MDKRLNPQNTKVRECGKWLLMAVAHLNPPLFAQALGAVLRGGMCDISTYRVLSANVFVHVVLRHKCRPWYIGIYVSLHSITCCGRLRLYHFGVLVLRGALRGPLMATVGSHK